MPVARPASSGVRRTTSAPAARPRELPAFCFFVEGKGRGAPRSALSRSVSLFYLPLSLSFYLSLSLSLSLFRATSAFVAALNWRGCGQMSSIRLAGDWTALMGATFGVCAGRRHKLAAAAELLLTSPPLVSLKPLVGGVAACRRSSGRRGNEPSCRAALRQRSSRRRTSCQGPLVFVVGMAPGTRFG